MRELETGLPRPRLRRERCPCHRGADLSAAHLSCQGPGERPHGPREITSSLAPSAPGSSRSLPSRALALSGGAFGGRGDPVPGTLDPLLWVLLASTISASTPLGGASPLAPLEPLRAPPLSVALVSSMGASFPTRGGLSAPTARSALRQPPFRATAQTVTRVFVKALARLPTAYGPGDRRLLPPASCFDHQHALAARVSVAERATDPHRRCR
jgi:hypothetical protein